ncbi:MAG: ABC transporter permease, partial [Eubacterium sp.]|nr:ABC transporter permease [Eubacterium sp.]
MKNKLSLGARFYIFLIFAFLYLPIIVMALFSFNDSTSTYIFTGFSTKWWNEMFANEAAMRALRNTLVLAVATALCSTAL